MSLRCVQAGTGGQVLVCGPARIFCELVTFFLNSAYLLCYAVALRYCILVVASGRVSIASSRVASLPLKLTKIAPSSSFRRFQKDGLGGGMAWGRNHVAAVCTASLSGLLAVGAHHVVVVGGGIRLGQ